MLVFEEAARAAGEGNDFARHVSLRNLLVPGHRLQIQIEFALREHGLMFEAVKHFLEVLNLHDPLVGA